MVDLEQMKKWAERLGEGESTGSDMETVSRLLHNAATELAARRREPVAQKPSVEERLVAYRCAAMEYAHTASVAEDAAHAMLAAERRR